MTSAQVGTLAAPSCRTYYSALRKDAEPHHHVSYAFSIPARVKVLFAVGHLHVGGLNIAATTLSAAPLSGRHHHTALASTFISKTPPNKRTAAASPLHSHLQPEPHGALKSQVSHMTHLLSNQASRLEAWF